MADLVEKGQALAVDDDPIELVATATESGAVTLRGQPVDVFGEMDRQALLSLELEVTRSYPVTKRDQVRLTFDKADGVKLESRGETAWVDDSHVRLAEELDRGVPRWAWIRGAVGTTIVAVLIWAELAYLIWNSDVSSDSDNPTVTRVGLTILMGSLVALLGGMTASVAIRKILPGFEVVRPGETGRGTRAMAIGGTILLAGIGVTASWALS